MPFVDFQEIKAENPIETVIWQLGLTMAKKGSQFRGPCPHCQDGGDRALVITPSKGAFYCFNAKKGGDIIALVAHVNDQSLKDAANEIASWTAVPEEKAEKPKPSEGNGFKPLDYLEADHDAVVALGFEPQDAERIGVGYAKRGVMRGTVAVPVRLSDGQLIGYIGVSEAILPSGWRF